MPVSAQTHNKVISVSSNDFHRASLADGSENYRGPLFASLVMMTEGFEPSREEPDLRSFIMPGGWNAPIGPRRLRFKSPRKGRWIGDHEDVSQIGPAEEDHVFTAKALTLPKGWVEVPQEGDGAILSFLDGKGTYRSSPTVEISGLSERGLPESSLYERNDLYKAPEDATHYQDAWNEAVKYIKTDERLGGSYEFYLILSGPGKSYTVTHTQGGITEQVNMDYDTGVNWSKNVRAYHRHDLGANFNACDISEKNSEWIRYR